MAREYSTKVCQELTEKFRQAQLDRPMRIQRYDPGTELNHEVTGVAPAFKASVRLIVEKFVGGGFAGQVYQVKLLEVTSAEGNITGLEVGQRMAMKIMVYTDWF